MTNTDITNVILLVIAFVGTVVSTFLIPWIKAKLTATQWQNLQDWAKVVVTAAEVLFKGTKLGKDKLEYAQNYLKELCEKNHYDYNEVEIRQAIENAWKNMTENEVTYRPEISE